MPNCDFYALPDDVRSVLEFVCAQPGWELHEAYSRPDKALLRFTAADAVLREYDIEREGIGLMLSAPEMGGRGRERRIEFRPGAVEGAMFRFAHEGWGLIQLQLVALRGANLRACHTNHNSEQRALAWVSTEAAALGPVSDWDWKAVQRVSSRLNRFIRSQAKSKRGSRPILSRAAAACREVRIELVW